MFIKPKLKKPNARQASRDLLKVERDKSETSAPTALHRAQDHKTQYRDSPWKDAPAYVVNLRSNASRRIYIGKVVKLNEEISSLNKITSDIDEHLGTEANGSVPQVDESPPDTARPEKRRTEGDPPDLARQRELLKEALEQLADQLHLIQAEAGVSKGAFMVEGVVDHVLKSQGQNAEQRWELPRELRERIRIKTTVLMRPDRMVLADGSVLLEDEGLLKAAHSLVGRIGRAGLETLHGTATQEPTVVFELLK